MRAPANEATGTSGESEVLAEFERLGWAGVLDSRHDTGTDLYLRPRDGRRFELGVILGAQVKTGPTWFAHRKLDEDGGVEGWWFYDSSREHVDYWLGHAVPHLLILRDQEANQSFWVHITKERVVSTGKGAKILVPRTNTVDLDHQDELIKAALTQSPSVTVEGTAWTGGDLLPRDLLRHALIAPRLVAPHPNAKPRALSPVEALASLVMLRPSVDRYFASDLWQAKAAQNATDWSIPSAEQVTASGIWGWSAVRALHQWLFKDDFAPICALREQASTSEELAAATVLAATVERTLGRPEAAISILRGGLDEQGDLQDNMRPADRAWLEAQLCSALLDVGATDESVSIALEVVRVSRISPADVTLGALSDAATMVIFQANGWQGLLDEKKGESRAVSIGDVISNGDTAAAWWWSQYLAWALPHEIDSIFRDWSPNESVRFGGDQAVRYLYAARTQALMAANFGDFSLASRLIAKHSLVRTNASTPAETVAALLTDLRLSGDRGDLKRAAEHIRRVGPLEALIRAANEIDPEASTRTTARADLALLRISGDLLGVQRASALVAWILAKLSSDAKDYLIRTGASGYAWESLIDLLRDLVHAATPDLQAEVIAYVMTQSTSAGDARDETLARLARAIPAEAWNSTLSKAEAQQHVEPNSQVAVVVLSQRARLDDAARAELLDAALEGSIDALEHLGDVRELPPDAVSVLVRRLAAMNRGVVDEARQGVFSFGGIDSIAMLTLLNLWHPGQAEWETVLEAFEEPSVPTSQQIGAIKRIAGYPDGVPVSVRPRLISAMEQLRQKPPSLAHLGHDDVRGQALRALVALGANPSLVDPMLGSPAEKAGVAHAVGASMQEGYLPLLALLASDPHAEVKAAAATALARWAVADVCICEASSVLERLIRSGGVAIAYAIAGPLSELQNVPESLAALVGSLKSHPSARVRQALDHLKPQTQA